jgi:hypothetical protein
MGSQPATELPHPLPPPSLQDLPIIVPADDPAPAASSPGQPLPLIIGLSVGGALAAALLAVGLAVACKACSRVREVRRFKRMKEEAGFLTAVIVARSSSERSPTASAYAHHAAYTVGGRCCLIAC